jgi:hypothetical protein
MTTNQKYIPSINQILKMLTKSPYKQLINGEVKKKLITLIENESISKQSIQEILTLDFTNNDTTKLVIELCYSVLELKEISEEATKRANNLVDTSNEILISLNQALNEIKKDIKNDR